MRNFRWYLVQAAVLAGIMLSGCGSSTAPTQSTEWRILVNPAQPVADRWAQFTMQRVDDTAFVAYKYVWDFDELNSILKRTLKTTTYLYGDTGVHNITCFAEDSLDHKVGEAHLRIRCIAPTEATTLETIADPQDWRSRRFILHAPPHENFWTYTWDFGDGTTATTYNDSSTSHHYTASGDYTVMVTVTESSYLLSTDTAHVTIASPVISASELNAMTSVTMYIVDSLDRRQEIVQLPFNNDAQYSYTAAPNFSAAYRYENLLTNGQTVRDTARIRLLQATLDANGLSLDDVLYFSLDTNHQRTESYETFSGCDRSYAAPKLEVQFASDDSIGFISQPGPSLYVDCHDSTSTQPSSGVCDPIDPVHVKPVVRNQLTGNLRALLVWKK